MEINEFNYEAYALDYAEGNLSGAELVAMERFLDGQPELKEEILAIAAVEVPYESVVYHGLEDLERKPERKGLMIPFSVLAVAASLVLLLGLFWLVSVPAPDGTLADRAPAIRIHYPVASVYDIETGPLDVRETNDLSNSADLITSAEVADGSALATNDLFEVRKAVDPGRVDKKTRIVWKVVEPKAEDFLEMMPEEEYRNLEVTELQADQYFVLPVTIEKTALQTAGFDRASMQLAEANERLERRRVLRDGALSVIQQNLMPAGIQDLIEE